MNMDLARFNPMACTLKQASPLEACLEGTSSIFNTSGPPIS
jgi:hypothetical protein